MTAAALPQHSSETPEHYTPPKFINAARAVMGDIDLDPASNKLVNDRHIGARCIFTQADDGLRQSWHDRVWLNPPGGKLKRDKDGIYREVAKGPGESSAAVWWAKLSAEYDSGRVDQAIFLAFTLEILRSTQQYPGTRWPGEVPFCVPDDRIRFYREIDGAFVEGTSPTHANLIAFLPPRRRNREGAIASFVSEFSRFGRVRT